MWKAKVYRKRPSIEKGGCRCDPSARQSPPETSRIRTRTLPLQILKEFDPSAVAKDGAICRLMNSCMGG
jgi:hypothetical protein